MKIDELNILANQLMFKVKEDEVENLENDFNTFLKQVKLLEKINTDDTIEMVRPFDEETNYLRDDEVKNVISIEDVLLNAPKRENEYFSVPKVIK